MYRQGDVFLVESDIPDNAQLVSPQKVRYVLAEGEATGHAHAIAASDAVELMQADGLLYVRAIESVEIVHEEHDPVQLPPGSYRVVRQREYSPQAIRRVVD